MASSRANVVIEGEDAAEFDAFAKGMRQELALIGDLQGLMADRVITTAWRLARVASLEADALTEHPELITLDYLDRPMPPGGKGFEKQQH